MNARQNHWVGVAVLCTLAFVGAGQVWANTIVLSLGTGGASGPAPTFSAGVWTYTYDVGMTRDSALQSGPATASGTVATTDGDYFAIFDIPGYVAGSATNISLATVGGATWTVSDHLLGLQPDDGVIVPDNGAQVNADFQYVGNNNGGPGAQQLNSAGLVTADPTVPADAFLGLISIQSTFAPSGSSTLLYNGQDFNNSTSKDQSNQSFVNGPNPALIAVPEPTTALLVPIAGMALALTARRRVRV